MNSQETTVGDVAYGNGKNLAILPCTLCPFPPSPLHYTERLKSGGSPFKFLFDSSRANYWQLREWHSAGAFSSYSLISIRVSSHSLIYEMNPFLYLLSIYHQIFIWSVSSTLNCNNDLWLFEISFKAADKIQKLLDISVLKEITEPNVLVWCLVWNGVCVCVCVCV